MPTRRKVNLINVHSVDISRVVTQSHFNGFPYISLRVSQGGSMFPCSLPKLPYVPMFPYSLRMFSYCNFLNFVPLFPKIG